MTCYRAVFDLGSTLHHSEMFFMIQKISLILFLEELFYHGCIYLIKNTVKCINC